MLRPTAALALLAVLALQACATTQEALPTQVKGFLAAGVDYRPFTTTELADPTVLAGVRVCEQDHGLHCREQLMLKEQRTSFTLGTDDHAYAAFETTGLSPGSAFNRACRLIDPGGSTVRVMRFPGKVPPDVTPSTKNTGFCAFGLPPGMPPGHWAIEFQVNNRSMLTLRFDLLAADNTGQDSV